MNSAVYGAGGLVAHHIVRKVTCPHFDGVDHIDQTHKDVDAVDVAGAAVVLASVHGPCPLPPRQFLHRLRLRLLRLHLNPHLHLRLHPPLGSQPYGSHAFEQTRSSGGLIQRLKAEYHAAVSLSS